MGTTQTPISATTGANTVLQANKARRYLYIKCYANQPNTTTPQTGTMYVAFGNVATEGTAGEMELVPGSEYVFGGPLPPSVANLPKGFQLPVCPQESISVIATGTMKGCIVEQ